MGSLALRQRVGALGFAGRYVGQRHVAGVGADVLGPYCPAVPTGSGAFCPAMFTPPAGSIPGCPPSSLFSGLTSSPLLLLGIGAVAIVLLMGRK